jgi:hypothetical protein
VWTQLWSDRTIFTPARYSVYDAVVGCILLGLAALVLSERAGATIAHAAVYGAVGPTLLGAGLLAKRVGVPSRRLATLLTAGSIVWAVRAPARAPFRYAPGMIVLLPLYGTMQLANPGKITISSAVPLGGIRALMSNYDIDVNVLKPEHATFLTTRVAPIFAGRRARLFMRGSASSTGTAAHNLALSRRRAENVATFLQSVDDRFVLAVATTRGAVEIWDMAARVQQRSLAAGPGIIRCVALSSDGARLAVGLARGGTLLFELPSGVAQARLTSLPGRDARFAEALPGGPITGSGADAASFIACRAGRFVLPAAACGTR